jgi:hypothetical protein
MKLGILLFGLLVTNAFGGVDGFEGLQCGSDIAKALIGKLTSNERIVVLEKRHADLALKDLGADEISDRLSCISWSICGSEFLILEENRQSGRRLAAESSDVVRDVLKVPPHSKTSPQFLGACEMNGKENKDIVVAILDDNEPGAKLLTARVAWKIDEKKMKFVTIPVEGLRCPRSGVITSDGGL